MATATRPITGLIDRLIDRLIDQLRVILDDDHVREIYFNSFGELEVLTADGHRRLESLQDWSSEQTVDLVMELAFECKVRIDPFHPFGGGVIPKMPWRWHGVVPPMAPDGPCLVLRKQRFAEIESHHFILKNFNLADVPEWMACGISPVIFGATGSGKTSFLVAVLKQFFHATRLGLMENIAEIPLLSKSWFRLVEVDQDVGKRGDGVSGERVVAEMMRLSPQVIVMGELRGSEALMLPQVARTGHGGILTTLHAGGFKDALTRLVSLARTPTEHLPSMMGIFVQRHNPTHITLEAQLLC